MGLGRSQVRGLGRGQERGLGRDAWCLLIYLE